MFDFDSILDFMDSGYIDKNGNLKVTSDRKDVIIYIANTLIDKTIFKSVSLNYLEYLGFESKNREFKLYLEDDYSFKLIVSSKDKCKYNCINDIGN